MEKLNQTINQLKPNCQTKLTASFVLLWQNCLMAIRCMGNCLQQKCLKGDQNTRYEKNGVMETRWKNGATFSEGTVSCTSYW